MNRCLVWRITVIHSQPSAEANDSADAALSS